MGGPLEGIRDSEHWKNAPFFRGYNHCFRECIPPVFIDDVICTLIFFQRPSRFAIRLWSVWSRIHTKKHLTCMFTTVVALWLLVTFLWGVPLTGPKQIYV